MRIGQLSTAVLAATLFTTVVQAQSFPDGATSITAGDLQSKLAGKKFMMKLADGTVWRVEYRTNGDYFFNSGNFSDSGDWKAEDNRLCSKGKRISASCNEVRIKDDLLYLKRDNGEIIQFVAQ